MFKYLSIFFIILFVFSCSSAIKIDPYSDNQSQKKDCKEDCKGLKGKQRADCNKRCN